MHHRFAIVPAGGSGTRFGGQRPKQFTVLAGQALVAHALDVLSRHRAVDAVFVAMSPEYSQALPWHQWGARVQPLPCAGATRSQTVLNALDHLSPQVSKDDWILVHDAARPCLSDEALTRLMDTVGDDEVGGLLAVPVADTLKRGDKYARVVQTVDREGLWAAQTPQMFRFGLLRRALQGFPTATDEASAIENLGHSPLLVMGETSNIKVTYPTDLALAEWILSRRHEAKGTS
jgi:2-C-methyl-D-erythritol 4-phosphate cytidylyltransferase